MFAKDALKGQRILVTGGGSGLGKEMSKHFLQHGSEVIICGRRQSVLEDMGWKIYRIWSTDWFQNPQAELKKLDSHIKRIINSNGENLKVVG